MLPLLPRSLLAALAVFALAGCYLFPKDEKVLAPPLLTSPDVTYATVTATRGTIESTASLTGDFVSRSQSAFFFRTSGSRLERIEVRLGDEVKTGTLLAELDTGSLENRIAQQKILVRKAQLISERAVASGKDRYERELASLDVDLASLQMQDLESQLSQSRLVCSMPGTVVYVAGVRPGDLVEAYRTVVQVADPYDLQVVCRGDQASDFHVGNAVTILLADGRKVKGTVVSAPGATPPDVSEDLRDAVVVQTLGGVPSGVRIGDPASVSRLLARRENIVVLPRDAVHTYLGRDFVQVLVDGEMQERTVELGITTVTEAEIVSGLKAGDQVISR